MLNKEEKKEMLADAKSLKRKKSFRQAGTFKDTLSLDDYIKFLMSIQKLFPYKPKSNHTKTRLNKL